jgi:peptidyl-prolyl cis-trans isomerase SDCCAG10
LEMLNAFRERLFKAKKVEKSESDDEERTEKVEHDATKDQSDVSLYTHRLEVDEEIRQKVIDANVADNDRYAIFDPRNPLNKRKREESKDIMKERKKSHLTSLALHSKAK